MTWWMVFATYTMSKYSWGTSKRSPDCTAPRMETPFDSPSAIAQSTILGDRSIAVTSAPCRAKYTDDSPKPAPTSNRRLPLKSPISARMARFSTAVGASKASRTRIWDSGVSRAHWSWNALSRLCTEALLFMVYLRDSSSRVAMEPDRIGIPNPNRRSGCDRTQRRSRTADAP